MSLVVVRRYEDRILISSDSYMGVANANSSDLYVYEKLVDMSKFSKHDQKIILGMVGYVGSTNILMGFIEHYLSNNEIIKSLKDVHVMMNKFYKHLKDIYISDTIRDIRDWDLLNFIMVVDDKIFEINSQIQEVTSFSAVGTGIAGALMCMELGKTPDETISIMAKHSEYISEPILSACILLGGEI